MAEDFQVIEVEPRRVLVVRNQDRDHNYGKVIMACLDRVWAFLKPNAVRTDHNVVVYKNGVITEAGVEIFEDVSAPEGLVMSETPAGRAATAVHWGSYDGIHASSEELVAFCKANGHALEGTNWEVYGDWSEDLSKLRTDIFWLLA